METRVARSFPRDLGAETRDWSALARQWGGVYGVDPALILAVIGAESSGDPSARGAAGEVGLMQVMPATASWMLGRPVGAGELRDPSLNVRAGAAYLAWQQGRYGGDTAAVVSAYNAGVATDRNPGYVARVFAVLSELVSPVMAEAGPFADSGQERSPAASEIAATGPLPAPLGGVWDTARRYWWVGVLLLLGLSLGRR